MQIDQKIRVVNGWSELYSVFKTYLRTNNGTKDRPKAAVHYGSLSTTVELISRDRWHIMVRYSDTPIRVYREGSVQKY
jgi:hypothetical protein